MYLATCNTILLLSIAMLILTQIFEFSNKKHWLHRNQCFFMSIRLNLSGVRFALGSFGSYPIEDSQRSRPGCFLR